MMRVATTIFLLVAPVIALAQNYPGMGGVDIQKMEKMQACMENIDEAKLQEIERRSSQIEAEIKSLCASGKRAEAQEKAMAFGKEMAANPTIQAMSKCGEMMQGMMPHVPFMEQGTGASSHHVCD